METVELGYLMLDNRLAGGTLFEASTYTCTHCSGVVVLNPERKRERYKCVACAHQICDDCAAQYHRTRACRSIQRLADTLLETAGRQRQADVTQSIILP